MAQARSSRGTSQSNRLDWTLWRRWVAANAVAELIGLGGSALVLIGLIALVDENSVGGILLMAAGAILLGTMLEGVVVGLLQWCVLRDALPTLPRRSWVTATAIGALIAWLLGMIPSTAMSLAGSGAESAAPAAEPPAWLFYLLAAGMGFVLGPVLGTPQWVVLRKHVRRAGWWVLANALAWMVGMVIIFLGTSAIPEGPIPPAVIMLLVGCVFAAGAAVGAVHGLFLIRLVRDPQ